MPKNFHQKGSIPTIIIILLIIIGISGVLIIKNIPTDKSQSTTNQAFRITKTESTPTATISQAKSKSQTPTPTQKATLTTTQKSPTPTSNNNNSNNPTSTPVPTSTATTIPTPTPTPKTYTYQGNNVNAKTICDQNSSKLFNVQISGTVTQHDPSSSNGIWTTLTGNGVTIVTSYDGGGNAPDQAKGVVINSINGTISPIRGGNVMNLKITDPAGTYEYELKVYEAPFTAGTPAFTNPIGNVSFATDCGRLLF